MADCVCVCVRERERFTRTTHSTHTHTHTHSRTAASSSFSLKQVMDSYGKKCNSKFLLHYGFAIESNREADGTCLNQLPVTLSLDPADPLFPRKSTMIKSEQRFKVATDRTIGQTSRALQYLRSVVATTAELDIGTNVGVVSASNEARALDEMARAMREVLSVYPSTIEEDDALLASPTLEPFSNQVSVRVVFRLLFVF